MGIQKLEHSVNISFNKPDPPAKKAVSQLPSERSIHPNELANPPAKKAVSQVPSERSIRLKNYSQIIGLMIN